MSARLRIQKNLEASIWAPVLAKSEDLIAVVLDGEIAWANAAFARVTGHDTLAGTRLETLIHPEDRQSFERGVASIRLQGRSEWVVTEIQQMETITIEDLQPRVIVLRDAS